MCLRYNKIEDAYKITKHCFDEILKIDKIENLEDIKKLNDAISPKNPGGGSANSYQHQRWCFIFFTALAACQCQGVV